MSEEHTRKLYVDKPKKAQLKQLASSRASSSTSMAPSTSMARRPPSTTHRPPIESFARRYKFLWPILLAANFSIGVYFFLTPKKQDEVMGKVEVSQVPISSVVAANSCTSPVAESKEFHP